MNPDDDGFIADEDGFVPDEPQAPEAPKPSTAEANAAWADALGPGDRARALTAAMRPGATEADRARARYLLERHAAQSMGTEDTAAPIVGRDERPNAGVTGVVQGATMGWADELGGAMRSQATGAPYEAERDALRQTYHAARAQAPGRTMQGELAGTMPTMAIPGGGSTALERVAIQGGIGAGLGTVSGAGFSEGTTPEEVATDAAMGGMVGGVMGAGTTALTETGSAGLQTLRRAASEADRARVASVATGTGRELNDTLVREAESMPGGIPAVAQRLRRMRIVPSVGTAQQVHQRATEALQEIGHAGRLGEITNQLDQTATVPRERLLAALDRYASSVEADPVMRRFGGAVRRRADDFAQTLPEEINYRRAIEILRGIGDQANWVDPVSGVRPPQEVARGTYRSVRSELDDIAEEALGRGQAGQTYRDAAPGAESPIDEYRRARLDTQAALFAQDWSERALGRIARSRGISPSDYAAAVVGGGGPNGSLLRAVVSAIANRSLRLRGGTMRATTAELAQRIVQQHPERLGRWAVPLARALAQGGPAFAAAHMALSTRDPEYRRAMESLSEEADQEQQQ